MQSYFIWLREMYVQLICLVGVHVCTELFFLVHVGICTTPGGYEVRPQTGGG